MVNDMVSFLIMRTTRTQEKVKRVSAGRQGSQEIRWYQHSTRRKAPSQVILRHL